MFCFHCGGEIGADVRFCIHCGQSQNPAAAPSPSSYVKKKRDSKGLWSHYISILTSPVLLIFRLVAQTTETVEVEFWGGTRIPTEITYLPTEMKVVLLLLLAISVFFVFSLRSNSKAKGELWITILLTVFNIAFGIGAAFVY